jgi:fructose-1,6-bisphosphatase
VFDSFGALRALFESLPAEFGAEEVGDAGVTGSRRHMIVRHFAEHPRFDCRLTSERPLRAEKVED